VPQHPDTVATAVAPLMRGADPPEASRSSSAQTLPARYQGDKLTNECFEHFSIPNEF